MTTEAAVHPRARTQSLNDVRAIIPESCYERSLTRAWLAVLQAIVLYAAPVVGLALTDTWWAVLGLWVLAGLGVAGLFVVGHDASHGALVDSRRLNRGLAQLCMVPSGHVEAAWDLGHNRIHHGYTTRQSFDFVWHPSTVEEYRAMGRLGRLRHRFEWSCFGSGAYFLRTVWWQKMWRFNAPGKRHDAIVRDKFTLGGVLALMLAGTVVLGALTGGVVGAFWVPFKMLVVPFLLFVQIIGWTVYVHHVDPDIKWWTRKEWTQFHGQMDSTTILHIPAVLNKLWFYNIMVHVPHHVDARIPFHQLPKAAEAITAAYPDTVRTSRLSPGSYFRATKACKLYDFDAGRWLPYSAAAAAPAAAPAAG
ncbi:MAG: fatty acid desaturase [Actinomycetota bacterium]|nr:fatty acid desaturase [Actinomycetota bacterium]